MDLTLDLNLGTYSPFFKPNHKPQYVHKQSNHPPNVKNNIAKGVNKRLSENSSNEEIFNAAAPIYQQSLKESGYDYELKFEPPSDETKEKKRQRTRNKTYFNPPYSSNVEKSVASEFLKLLDITVSNGAWNSIITTKWENGKMLPNALRTGNTGEGRLRAQRQG